MNNEPHIFYISDIDEHLRVSYTGQLYVEVQSVHPPHPQRLFEICGVSEFMNNEVFVAKEIV